MNGQLELTIRCKSLLCSRGQIEASRTLMLRVSSKNLFETRQRLERSERRLSRSLTLLLESRDRVDPATATAPAIRLHRHGSPAPLASTE